MARNTQFSGSNISLVKEHNLQAILLSFLHEQRISRVELSQRTALSSTTITNLTAELLEEGIIQEQGEEERDTARRVGRPRTMLRLVPDARYAIGVHIGIGLYRVAITNLHAEILAHIDGDYRLGEPPTQVLQAISDSVRRIINDSGINRERILGLGVGASGLVDRKLGVNVFAPRLGWRNVEIGRRLHAWLDLPVSVENNVRAMAIGEAFFGDGKEANVLAFVYGRIGVGAGFVMDGQVYRGSEGGAGEFGHMIMLNEGGQTCSCGQRGCLETLVTEHEIVRQAQTLATNAPDSLLANHLSRTDEIRTIEKIFAAAREGDEAIQALLTRRARYLGIALANLVNILNPDLILLGGMFAEGIDLILPSADLVMREMALGELGAKVRLKPTRFGWRAGVIGASSLALMNFFYKNAVGI